MTKVMVTPSKWAGYTSYLVECSTCGHLTPGLSTKQDADKLAAIHLKKAH